MKKSKKKLLKSRDNLDQLRKDLHKLKKKEDGNQLAMISIEVNGNLK
jgi:hypothetical protein